MANIHSFSKSFAEQNKRGEETETKKQKNQHQACQGPGILESIIIFVWVRFRFGQPDFGMEMDILTEPLQVVKYLIHRGADEMG